MPVVAPSFGNNLSWPWRGGGRLLCGICLWRGSEELVGWEKGGQGDGDGEGDGEDCGRMGGVGEMEGERKGG